MITGIRCDGIGLAAAIVHRSHSGRGYCTIRSGCCGNRIRVDCERHRYRLVRGYVCEQVTGDGSHGNAIYHNIGHAIVGIRCDHELEIVAIIHGLDRRWRDRPSRSGSRCNSIRVNREARIDYMISSYIREGIIRERSLGYFINRHISNMIAGVRGDHECPASHEGDSLDIRRGN